MIGGGGACVCVCSGVSPARTKHVNTILVFNKFRNKRRRSIGDCFTSDWQQERIPQFTPPPYLTQPRHHLKVHDYLFDPIISKESRDVCFSSVSDNSGDRSNCATESSFFYCEQPFFFSFSALQQLHSHARNHISYYNGSDCVQPHKKAFQTRKSPKESSQQFKSVPGNSLTAFQKSHSNKCDLLFTYIWRGLI